jgi:XTP/dITP diphosphohydrolase
VTAPTRLVLATGNPGKVAELEGPLATRGIEVVAAADAGVAAFPPEDGASYDDNAMVKAGHVATVTGLPALADDSGLEVDALNGAPGVHSARFGGDGLSDGERVAHLLARLRGVPTARRGARFVSVLVLATPGGDVRRFEGTCSGRILEGPRGNGGFGYDPVFWSDDLGKAFGVATPDEKRTVSHRARALAAFLSWLDGDEAHAVLTGPPPS